MAHRLPIPKRTDGDGMEDTEKPIDDSLKIKVELEKPEGTWCDPIKGISEQLLNVNVKPRLTAKELMKSNQLICLKPVLVPKERLNRPVGELNEKEPRFVPFEPYKAATRPIIPKKKTNLKNKVLVHLKPREESCSSDCKSDIEEKISSLAGEENLNTQQDLKEELSRMKLENKELERQLNYQVQVNGELKHLLVAAVGEDMETRVNSLTEDKFHLAQALLNSAKTLSTHQEQVEWLASQCEVYRSKFLASSVMVEELAGWKASLSHTINEGHDIVRKLLEERRLVRKNLLHSYLNLMLIRDNFDLLSRRNSLTTSNIIDLSAECTNISNGLVVQLLGGEKKPASDLHLQQLPHFTEAEKSADFLLKNPYPVHLLADGDIACNAVMGAAVAISGQLYHESHPPRIQCCPQCTGQIKLV